MSFAKNLKVIVPGTIFALALGASGLALADSTDRADELGQAMAFKQQPSNQAAPAVQVKKQTREQVKTSQYDTGRSDALGLAISAKNESPAQVNSALAATKHTGSNQSGQ